MSTIWCRAAGSQFGLATQFKVSKLRAGAARKPKLRTCGPAPSRLAERLALELAGHGLGEGLEELDDARVLVGGDALFHEVLQLLDEGDVPYPAGRQHDAGLHDHAALGVRRADHRALAHGRVR